MIGFIQEIEIIAEQYGLKISSIDATDITIMARLELLSSAFIQIYRNSKKNKLNMALVVGSNRIYGFDFEGGVTHEHPIESPESHVPVKRSLGVEEFILDCL